MFHILAWFGLFSCVLFICVSIRKAIGCQSDKTTSKIMGTVPGGTVNSTHLLEAGNSKQLA